jgi:hypothetical protein
MTKTLIVTLLAILSGCIAVAIPPAAAEHPAPTPSLELAMPAPQEPYDTTVISAVETVGAAADQ